MTRVTLAIDVLVVPTLFVIVAAWCSIAAGIVRRIVVRVQRVLGLSESVQLLDVSTFFSEMGASLRSRSVARIAGMFYHRPIEGMLMWIAMLVAGMIVMATWSGLVIAISGHYP